jgi:hypothetical protein
MTKKSTRNINKEPKICNSCEKQKHVAFFPLIKSYFRLKVLGFTSLMFRNPAGSINSTGDEIHMKVTYKHALSLAGHWHEHLKVDSPNPDVLQSKMHKRTQNAV